jgi:hypothetical protein
MRSRWQAGLAVPVMMLALAGLGWAVFPRQAEAQCALSGKFVRLSDDQPVSGVQVILLSGGSTSTDAAGAWRLPVSQTGMVKTRVITPVSVYDPATAIIFSGELLYAAVIPAGTSEVTYRMFGCSAELWDVSVVFRDEGPVGRPVPPPAPAGWSMSEATRTAVIPESFPGNPGNLPWLGGFWLTAPVVTLGICPGMDHGTQIAAEEAIQRWQAAADQGLAWKLIRDDAACDDSFRGPKMLIKRETVSSRRYILGRINMVDMDGQPCVPDLRGTTCWIGTVTVSLNPPGFDRLDRGEQMLTVLHEMGHALGLAHNRGCGDSVMWFDAGGCSNARPPDRPGLDDISSLNELLAATLKALRPTP